MQHTYKEGIYNVLIGDISKTLSVEDLLFLKSITYKQFKEENFNIYGTKPPIRDILLYFTVGKSLSFRAKRHFKNNPEELL